MQILKRLQRVGPYERWMFGIVALATLLRFILIYFHWPATNSDEGNMGLVALHVAYQGDHPVFFYGLPYMGPLEGYVAAALFHIFGASLLTLRLALLPFSIGFLISMYYLVRLLYDRKFALAMVIVLSLGSSDVLFLQLRAVGEYPEMMMFAPLICVLAAWLALSAQRFEGEMEARQRRKRAIVYGILGLSIGLAIWVDFLILPFVATAVVLLWLFCRRELLRWSGLALLAGVIVGVFPLIYYNLTAPLDQNSLNILLDIHHGGASDMLAQHLTWLNQLVGTVLVALPWATGANPRCPLSAIPPVGTPTSATWSCVLYQGGWGVGYLVLWGIATFVVVYAIWSRRRNILRASTGSFAFEERWEAGRQCGRLMVLASAAMTLVLYASAPSPAVSPETTFRYLACMLVALPMLLWPVWQGLGGWRLASGWRPKSVFLLRGALVLLVAVTFVSGTVRTFMEIPAAQVDYQNGETLIRDLEQIGATRIYSDYWTCNWVTFQSQEKIICSVLNTQLRAGFDRYLPYRALVHAAPHPVYVFSLSSADGKQQIGVMQQRIGALNLQYHHYMFDGYVAYQPVT